MSEDARKILRTILGKEKMAEENVWTPPEPQPPLLADEPAPARAQPVVIGTVTDTRRVVERIAAQRSLEKLSGPQILGKAGEPGPSGNRDRASDEKLKNFSNIAALWNAWMQIRRDPKAPLDGHDVAQMLGLMKKARTQTGSYSPDDYVDDAGYAGIAGEIAAP